MVIAIDSEIKNSGSEELSKLFIQLRDKGKVSGLFLTSAVCGSSESTMERMIKSRMNLRLS
jgi:predicted DNA-binding helix-hairpin-helix protein